MSIKPLNESTRGERDQLSVITKERETMRWIGTGVIWTREKIEQIYEWSQADAMLGQCERGNWAWLIIAGDGVVVGFISLRPTNTHVFQDGPQLRYFIGRDYQRRGYASTAFRAVLSEVKAFACPHLRAIYSFINPENGPSIAMSVKAGFVELGKSHGLLVFELLI